MTAFILGVVGLVAPSPAVAQPVMEQEELNALAKPSIVYISITWTAYVRYPINAERTAWEWSDAVETTGACSGFVVDASGYIQTAGHCVDIANSRGDVLSAWLNTQVEEKTLTDAQADALFKEGISEWRIEGGVELNTPPARLVEVIQPASAGGVSATKEFTANVVEDRPPGRGDVALLKVQTDIPMPALTVAEADPEVGSAVTLVGYPGSVFKVVDPTLEPTFNSGKVSSRKVQEGVPVTQVDAAMAQGMSGGPAINEEGHVVGLNSFGVTAAEEGLNFTSSVDSIQEMLSRNGVEKELNNADKAYRAGLRAYYSDDYSTAVTEFEKVLEANQSHALAQQYKTRAIEEGGGSEGEAKSRSSQDESFPWTSLALIGLVLVLVALAGLFFWHMRRGDRRSETTPATPAPLATPSLSEPPPAPEQKTCDHDGRFWVSGSEFCPRCGKPLPKGPDDDTKQLTQV